MNDQQYKDRHATCIGLDDFKRDMARSGAAVWKDERGHWCYILRGSAVVRYFEPQCNHPEDPVCTKSPTQEMIEAATGKPGRPKKAPQENPLLKELIDGL